MCRHRNGFLEAYRLLNPDEVARGEASGAGLQVVYRSGAPTDGCQGKRRIGMHCQGARAALEEVEALRLVEEKDLQLKDKGLGD